MTVLELTKYSTAPTAQTNHAPFVYHCFPGIYTTADYWVNTFGCPREDVETSIYIASFVQDAVLFYSLMASLADCRQQEFSFFFLVATEILYIHYDHSQNRHTAQFDSGDQLSFNDKGDIYIDNLYCAGLLRSVPSMAQKQDIDNYSKLALKPGTAVLDNISDPFTMRGRLDDLITRKLYGNDARLYYLDATNGRTNYTRSELIDLAAFTIDDYDVTIQQATIKLLDKRAAQNIKIPYEYFTSEEYPDIDEKYIGEVIPFGYGPIRSSEGIPTNGNAADYEDVVYRQATELTMLGEVQLKIDDKWVEVTPDSVDLTRGEFTVYADDARNPEGAPYECRVLGSTAIMNDYAPDCIVDMNARFLGVLYTDSAYDREEWEAEKVAICSIGVLFTEQIELFDAIRIIQNGCNVGFRYEVNASGRRTIRVDDHDRETTRHITNMDIQNRFEMPIPSQKDMLASVVHVTYGHDYMEDADYFIDNEDNLSYVLNEYRQLRKQIDIPAQADETILTNEADAEERGEWQAARFADPPKVAQIDLRGKDYYNLRLLDMLTIEITPGMVEAGSARVVEGREYFGIWKVKVIKIDPQTKSLLNKTELLLVEKIEPIAFLRVTEEGVLRSCGRDGTAWLLRGGR